MNAATFEAGRFGSGQAVQRVEDPALLAGRGQFTDDVVPAGQLHGVFVRSPHAHARIASIDTAAAAKMPGVAAVFTGAQWVAAGVKPLPTEVPFKRSDGKDVLVAPRRALAHERVRYVGEPVVMVVASSRDAARAAADAVVVEYDELPAVTDVVAAMRPGAPKVVEALPDNEAAAMRYGDAAAAQAAFQRAAVRVAVDIHNQRLAPAPMEPRAVLAEFDAKAQRLQIRLSSQMPTGVRDGVCGALGLKADAVRVVVGDVGGGFGMKTGCYPEDVAVAQAARALARPVKWRADRLEEFLSAVHGRDVVCHAELALDARRQGAGIAREGSGQHRRLCHRRRPVHPAGRGPVGDDQHLRHPDHRPAAECGDDAHRQPGAVSRRGPARGDLHHRAAVRRRSARNEARPCRAAPPQHDPPRADALHETRWRRCTTAGSSRRSSNQGLDAGRLERLRRAPRGRGAPRPAARPWHRHVSRVDQRRGVRRARRGHRHARRRDRAVHRGAGDGAGHRHQPGAAGGRRVPGADRPHPGDDGRHRPQQRLRQRGLALGVHRRLGAARGVEEDDRRGAFTRRQCAGGAGRRHRIQGGPLLGDRHRPRHWPVRAGRSAARRAHLRWTPPALSVDRAGPTPATCARWRSIRTPVRWRSSPTRRSTTSGA